MRGHGEIASGCRVIKSRDTRLEELCAGLGEEDALALREERAGILEFQGGMERQRAELRSGLVEVPR